MLLLTKEIIQKLPKIGSTDGQDPEKRKGIVKFFTPDADWTWYATEGEQRENGDYEFFGVVTNSMGTTWGYFYLSELQKVQGSFGLPIERDRFYSGDLPKAALQKISK
jgi:hypothetical protein